MSDEFLTTGQAFGGGGALAVIAGVAYRFLRIVKTDKREDAKAQRADDFSESLLKRVRELELRVDVMAKERNDALERNARMEVEIQYLKKKVEDLEKINETLAKGTV